MDTVDQLLSRYWTSTTRVLKNLVTITTFKRMKYFRDGLNSVVSELIQAGIEEANKKAISRAAKVQFLFSSDVLHKKNHLKFHFFKRSVNWGTLTLTSRTWSVEVPSKLVIFNNRCGCTSCPSFALATGYNVFVTSLEALTGPAIACSRKRWLWL